MARSGPPIQEPPLGSGAGSDSRTHWQGVFLASPLPSLSAHVLICVKVGVVALCGSFSFRLWEDITMCRAAAKPALPPPPRWVGRPWWLELVPLRVSISAVSRTLTANLRPGGHQFQTAPSEGLGDAHVLPPPAPVFQCSLTSYSQALSYPQDSNKAHFLPPSL